MKHRASAATTRVPVAQARSTKNAVVFKPISLAAVLANSVAVTEEFVFVGN